MVIGILIFVSPLYAYDVDPPNEVVHQHITNESVKTWRLIPYEIKSHAFHNIRDNLDVGGFDNDEDIIIGSGEEDREDCPWPGGYPWCDYYKHFWQPDNPREGDYDDGLNFWGRNYDSSYERAVKLWKTKVIPLYIKGETNESYYWLGRVAHLLEDASQPSHLQMDIHPGGTDPSILEDYTADNFNTLRNTYNWQGQNFADQQYNYENLINNFDWSAVDPPSEEDRHYIELFRLFWYTAQKTQYWASDDENGNIIYQDLNNNVQNWQCSGTGSLNLWADQGYTSCSNFINNSADLNAATVDREANATIPHAMRAVAGLYRLFDDAVRIDWPTENHDFRRTGFTLLKGDMDEENDISRMDFVMEPLAISGQEQVVKAIVADVDGNGKMETVSFVHKNTQSNQTRIYAVEVGKEKKKYENGYKQTVTKKWGSPITMLGVGGAGGAVYFPGTLANVDTDNENEAITKGEDL